MLVPNATRAVVPAHKLTAYLLALAHPVGGSKARLFRAHGFDDHNVEALVAGLLGIVTGAASSARPGPFGTKYTVVGELATPRGTAVQIETLWIIEPHDDRPRFVTAYPSSANRP